MTITRIEEVGMTVFGAAVTLACPLLGVVMIAVGILAVTDVASQDREY
jgi:hypothetical protein